MTPETGSEEQGGAAAETDLGIDPRQAALEHFDQRMLRDGISREDAAGESLNLLANVAMRGDKRVIVGESWKPHHGSRYGD